MYKAKCVKCGNIVSGFYTDDRCCCGGKLETYEEADMRELQRQLAAERKAREKVERQRDQYQSCHESELGVCFQHCEEVQALTAERNMWKMKCAEADGNTERVSEERDRLREALEWAVEASDAWNFCMEERGSIWFMTEEGKDLTLCCENAARAARSALQAKAGGES